MVIQGSTLGLIITGSISGWAGFFYVAHLAKRSIDRQRAELQVMRQLHQADRKAGLSYFDPAQFPQMPDFGEEMRPPPPREEEAADEPPGPQEPVIDPDDPHGWLPQLAHLWVATHQRLDYYHEIATSQARKSFRNAQAAMVIGFVILVGIAGLATFAKTSTGTIVVGSMGIAGAAMAGFISRTFVRSQESTADHLRVYFDQPLEFARLLNAERLLISVSPDKRAETLIELAKAHLAQSAPEPSANTPWPAWIIPVPPPTGNGSRPR